MAGALIICVLILGSLAGCGHGGDPGGAAEPEVTSRATGKGGGGVRLRKLGDFEQPLYVTQPPDGSEDLYVVEKTGRVRIVRDGRQLERPFLDLSGEVSSSSEQGLLSIAFAPDFSDSRLLYAYFTGSDGDQHVIELRANPEGSAIEPDSRRQVLEMDDFAPNHNGGLLVFGPDGTLYIGTGDGGFAGDPERNGQDLSSLLGKILRIDPVASGGEAYSIPSDNPFVGRPGARAEVYAYGLRNPWRFSFDRGSGDLTVGDVGQDALEEVDYVPAEQAPGANFGWSAFEGEQRFNPDQTAPGHVRPALVYGRDEGCSVTGGYVIRDRELSSLYGRYLYGDYCSGELRSFVPGARARDDRPLGLRVPSLSSFGEGAQGHLYAVSLEGAVYRLAPA